MRQIFFITVLLSSAFSAGAADIDMMIFEEQRIEGKIRRPQVVLIRADQRPDFVPMVMQSIGRKSDFADYVNEDVIESSKYSSPFSVMGGKIIYNESD